MPDDGQQKHLIPADKQRSVTQQSSLASRGLELALNVRQKNESTLYDECDAIPELVRWWYYRANEQQDAEAQYMLGVMYDGGDGVPQDAAEAVRWYLRAAEQGDADAQYNLGVSYANGEGISQDDVEAAYWYRQAAEQGDADAQVMLGVLYAEAQSDKLAVYWYCQAAEQGHMWAQFYLGARYGEGKGVLQDYVQAHKWFNLAASEFSSYESEREARDKAMQLRDEVESKMTPAQIAEAQRLAREWKPGL